MQPSADLHPPVYSVSDLNAYIRALLESNHNLTDIWVAGEISNLSRPASGHVYFILKDADAAIRCVIWRENARMLSGTMYDGMAIEAHGYVSVYEQGGQYQLYVNALRAAGEGLLYRKFLRLKAKLEAEGLFAEERKRPLPPLPRVVGVVASKTSAAFQDILNTLHLRFPMVQVILAHASVQGEAAPLELVAALNALNRSIHPDVILLARGGGSLEDLWAFNDERVVRAVAASAAPVVSGVGHETDFTLVDFVADARAPTPTAAAVLAVPDKKDLQADLDALAIYLKQGMGQRIAERRMELREGSNRLERASPMWRVREGMQRVDELYRQLERNMMVFLRSQNQRLHSLSDRLTVLNPQHVLQRGYALVRDRSGRPVTSLEQVQLNDHMRVQLYNGTFGADVTEIEKER